jgi:hypothetical protein
VRAYHRSSPLFRLGVASAVVALAGAAARVSSAPAQAQAVKPQAERAAHMQVHFSQVMTVHEAVIRGDLAAVRAPATWLAEHDAPSSLPAGSAPFVAEMRRAARRTAQAPTVLEAALGTADMLKTCGDCHRGVGTTPAATHPSGPEVGGLVGHMLAHQTSADQMLQGLIVPSSALWRAGADGFSAAPLRTEALPKDPKLTPGLAAAEARIHELAAQAGKAEDGGARAVFYAQIIARCADCHAVHRKVWGPSRRDAKPW